MSRLVAVNGGVDVALATTPVVVQNDGRREITIVNDGANTVYLSLGTGAAVAGVGVRLNATGGTWSSNAWDGAVQAIALVGVTHVTVAEF